MLDPLAITIALAIRLVMASFVSMFARDNGRNRVAWFLFGFALPIYALFIAVLFDNSNLANPFARHRRRPQPRRNPALDAAVNAGNPEKPR